MTQFKIDTKLGELAAEGIDPYVDSLYDNRGMELLGIVSMKSVDRSQPVDGSNIKPYVKVRLMELEISTVQDPMQKLLRLLFEARNGDEASQIRVKQILATV